MSERDELAARPAYMIEKRGGCACCGSGAMWDVIHPDGSAHSVSFADEERAQELAEDLAAAFTAGRDAERARLFAEPSEGMVEAIIAAWRKLRFDGPELREDREFAEAALRALGEVAGG